MDYLLDALSHFWKRYPGLLYGLSALFGCYASLQWHWSLVLPVMLVFFPLILTNDGVFRTRLCIALAVLASMIAYVKTTIRFPDLPENASIKGSAVVDIDMLSLITKHYGQRWLYRGTIKSFIRDGETVPMAYNIPVTINIPHTVERPPAGVNYVIRGNLRHTDLHRYSLQPERNEPWLAMAGTWSLAEFRFKAKQFVISYLKDHIPDERSATFLSGIATGDFQDRLMSFEFSRFGLQHIMAISGFHFAIVAGILSVIMRILCDKRTATLLLMSLLCAYFIFLGCGPSIMRAWIAAMIALLSALIERRSLGLNSLGIGLLAILAYDPLLCSHMGFQFSFVTTAAILLFFNSSDHLVQHLYHKRPLMETIRMNGWNQHGYFALTCIRQALALTLAVNLVALPTTLYFFLKFPWLSLIYNLFFPFMVSISMLLLILGGLCSLAIPCLATFLHGINSFFTRFMLDYTYNIPISLDAEWRIASFPLPFLVSYLCFLFLGGIIYLRYLETINEDRESLIFI